MKLAALAAGFALASCATVVAGGPDLVPIRTNPPGAYVYVNGQVVGQTPITVELDRGHSVADIRIYYPGFLPIQVLRSKTLNGWVLGNLFLLIWPVIIDLATSNWERFDDDPILVGLTPGQAPPPPGAQPQPPLPPSQPSPAPPAPSTRPAETPAPPAAAAPPARPTSSPPVQVAPARLVVPSPPSPSP